MDHQRLLALAPSSHGIGYAVFEGKDRLIGCGVKRTQGKEKNLASLKKLKQIIGKYQPGVVVMQGMKGVRRSARIKQLNHEIIVLCRQLKLKVKIISQDQLTKAFFPDRTGTKHERAEIIARRFPDELGFYLPPKRKTWDSEDARMGIFDAMALAIASLIESDT